MDNRQAFDGFLIVDLETTGLYPSSSEILEGHFIKADLNLNIIDEITLNFKPTKWDDSAVSASMVHGITEEMAMKFPKKEESLLKLLNWLEKKTYSFVCHANRNVFGVTSSYDYTMLMYQFHDMGSSYRGVSHFDWYQRCPTRYILSTHEFSLFLDKEGIINIPRKVVSNKNVRDFSLDSICKYFKIKNENYHNAKNDCHLCFEILKKLDKKKSAKAWLTGEITWKKESSSLEKSTRKHQRSEAIIHSLI